MAETITRDWIECLKLKCITLEFIVKFVSHIYIGRCFYLPIPLYTTQPSHRVEFEISTSGNTIWLSRLHINVTPKQKALGLNGLQGAENQTQTHLSGQFRLDCRTFCHYLSVTNVACYFTYYTNQPTISIGPTFKSLNVSLE